MQDQNVATVLITVGVVGIGALVLDLLTRNRRVRCVCADPRACTCGSAAGGRLW